MPQDEVTAMVKTVLIVDDNTFFRRVLRQRFDCEPDFEVCGEAENGKDAVHKALELRPDLIVLDLSMPVMNGIDAARILRLLMPEIPLIMDSAISDKFAEDQARVIGISEIVSKSAPQLIQKARFLLGSAARPTAA